VAVIIRGKVEIGFCLLFSSSWKRDQKKTKSLGVYM